MLGSPKPCKCAADGGDDLAAFASAVANAFISNLVSAVSNACEDPCLTAYDDVDYLMHSALCTTWL